MNVIFFSRHVGKARHLNLSHPVTFSLVTIAALGVVVGIFALGLHIGERSMARMALLNPGAAVRAQQAEVAALKSQLQDRVDALAMRLGVMNAHVIRLNALGKRLTEMAHINSREFNFDDDPPQGGSDSDGVGRGAQVPDLTLMIDELGRRIDLRSGQFSALEHVILGRQLSLEIKPSGRPVREGGPARGTCAHSARRSHRRRREELPRCGLIWILSSIRRPSGRLCGGLPSRLNFPARSSTPWKGRFRPRRRVTWRPPWIS